jgi:hypothetical protein
MSAPDPEVPGRAGPGADGEERPPATVRLWRRRARQSPAIPSAAALIGIDSPTLSDATAISLAASEEATVLLDGMELRVRTLKTTVSTESERCVFSVRGPVLWSETITARANALGNEDVFVCMTAGRSFDTVENQVLVAALEAIARAGRALNGPTGEEVERIGKVAAEAAAWRNHPRLADVRPGRLQGRAMARLRGGHRMARLAPVLAVRHRVREPFIGEDLVGLSDAATQRYHEFVSGVIDAVRERTGRGGTLTFSDGGLWAGPVSFRHPASPGGGIAGLAVRGRPVLPPEGLVDDAPWASELPVEGVRVRSEGDLEGLVAGLSPAPTPPR